MPAGTTLHNEGFRQQRTLGGYLAYLAHEAVVGPQPFDDLLAGQTLGDRHLVRDRLALGDDINNLPYAGCLRDQIFASLQLQRAAAFCPVGSLGR